MLTRAAVDFRYPGETADAAEAREAFAVATDLRRRLRVDLGLDLDTTDHAPNS